MALNNDYCSIITYPMHVILLITFSNTSNVINLNSLFCNYINSGPIFLVLNPNR